MEIIAYYLPQYYPFEENNKWWGEGFTEWTNVGKAKPLFNLHDQPKVPADLGYYDLRMAETREKQVKLAIEAGVTCFCYWHYWFGNKKQLLDIPFKSVLESGNPNFPFCLGWANESWKSKVWNTTDSSKDKILIEQTYPGEADIKDHFYSLLPAFKDIRYLKVNGKPVFVCYKPLLIPNVTEFITTWNELAKSNGFKDGIFFIGYTINIAEKDSILGIGFHAVNVVRTGEYRFNRKVIKRILLKLIKFKFFNKPLVLNYSFISKFFIQEEESIENIYPTIIPNWDHTPRSGRNGVVYHNSTSESFEKHCIKVLNVVKKKSKKNQIVFLKSWNEWGEGNYMEPDLKNGKKFITTLRKVIELIK
jgi:hypothetical protein